MEGKQKDGWRKEEGGGSGRQLETKLENKSWMKKIDEGGTEEFKKPDKLGERRRNSKDILLEDIKEEGVKYKITTSIRNKKP